MDDDMAARLQAMFPGDLMPTDGVPDTHVPMRVRRSILRGYVRDEPPPSPVTAEKFRRVMEALPAPPTHIYRETPAEGVTIPTTAYVLESSANAKRWLEEATDIQSDVKLGQSVEPHRVTRLLLEAIPVVQDYASRP